jgi:hypothetical protein
VQTEPKIAFAAEISDPPGLEIRINFGIFAGRDATAAEVDELAQAVVPEVGEVSIVAEQRHEVGEDVEASLHQVRIEVGEDQLPPAGPERDVLTGRLLERAERWAEACIAERHAEISAEL